MHRAVALGLILVFMGAAWLAASAEDEPAAPAVVWHDDLEAARAKARKEGRPLLAVFQ